MVYVCFVCRQHFLFFTFLKHRVIIISCKVFSFVYTHAACHALGSLGGQEPWPITRQHFCVKGFTFWAKVIQNQIKFHQLCKTHHLRWRNKFKIWYHHQNIQIRSQMLMFLLFQHLFWVFVSSPSTISFPKTSSFSSWLHFCFCKKFHCLILYTRDPQCCWEINCGTNSL